MLASWADTDGRNVFPSLATLAVAAEVDYKTAKKALSELLAAGLVEKVARRSGVRGRFDEYRLCVAADVTDRVEVLSPDEYQAAAEKVRSANRKPPGTGKQIPRTPVDDVVDSPVDDWLPDDDFSINEPVVRGTARPKPETVRGTARQSYGERGSGVPLSTPHLQNLSLISPTLELAESHSPQVRASAPTRDGFGFCLACYHSTGQVVLAVDQIAGAACSQHLAAKRVVVAA